MQKEGELWLSNDVKPGLAGRPEEKKPAIPASDSGKLVLILEEQKRQTIELRLKDETSDEDVITAIVEKIEEKLLKKSKIKQIKEEKDASYKHEEQKGTDYGKLFSYLGQLKTAGYMYGHLEGEENKPRYQNGESFIKNDQVQWFIRRKMLEDIMGGSTDQGNPLEREKFELWSRCNWGEKVVRYSISMT